jgi:hypothetical protein
MLLAGQHAATQVREFFVVDGDEAVKKALGELVSQSLHCAPRLLFLYTFASQACVRVYRIAMCENL